MKKKLDACERKASEYAKTADGFAQRLIQSQEREIECSEKLAKSGKGCEKKLENCYRDLNGCGASNEQLFSTMAEQMQGAEKMILEALFGKDEEIDKLEETVKAKDRTIKRLSENCSRNHGDKDSEISALKAKLEEYENIVGKINLHLDVLKSSMVDMVSLESSEERRRLAEEVL